MPGGDRVTGSLAELIDRADPKLVSVDVWDTLIVRDRPADAAKLATARRMVLNPAVGGTPQGADRLRGDGAQSGCGSAVGGVGSGAGVRVVGRAARDSSSDGGPAGGGGRGAGRTTCRGGDLRRDRLEQATPRRRVRRRLGGDRGGLRFLHARRRPAEGDPRGLPTVAGRPGVRVGGRRVLETPGRRPAGTHPGQIWCPARGPPARGGQPTLRRRCPGRRGRYGRPGAPARRLPRTRRVRPRRHRDFAAPGCASSWRASRFGTRSSPRTSEPGS